MWLVIRNGPQQGRRVQVADRLVIGRDEGCDLALAEPAASRQHAVLERLEDGRILVRDLGSTNGTHVNEFRITGPTLLRGGEQIRIGDTVLVTSQHEPSPEPTVSRPVVAPPVTERPPGPATVERHLLRRGVRRVTYLVGGVALVVAVVVVLFITGVLPPGPRTVAEIVEEVAPSAVAITTRVDGQPFSGGTGWVVDAAQGLVVTNAHVVNGGTDWLVGVEGQDRTARLVAAAPCDDLALLQVDDATGLRTLPLGSQEGLRQGDTVVAVGFPGTASQTANLTATEGIVSVARTRWDLPGLDVPMYPNVIQTDAAINPGNSGGPLVDQEARLVGVNSAGITLLGGRIIQGQGYAIGVDRVKEIIPLLSQGRSIAWTGMGIEHPTQESDLTELGLPPTPGLIVLTAVPGSPAEAAGFGEEPRLITAIDGTPMDGSLPTYCDAVGDAQRSQEAVFTVVTAGSTASEQVEVSFG